LKIITDCAIIDDMKLKIKRLSDKVRLPKYAHSGDACFDLCVLVDSEHPPMYASISNGFTDIHDKQIGETDEKILIRPRETRIFHTGLKFETEPGYNMKIYVRSSTGIKKNLVLSNGTGVVDTATYRGEVLIGLTNIGNVDEWISNGERVAQAEIVKTLDVEIDEVSELSDTVRGEGGFGSTGGH